MSEEHEWQVKESVGARHWYVERANETDEVFSEDDEASAGRLAARLNTLESQLAEALSQRQAAVEEAERSALESDEAVEVQLRLERELAAANQDARSMRADMLAIRKMVHAGRVSYQAMKSEMRSIEALAASHTARLASRPPAEAEGA